jgi:putative sigma-54 modulation protein
VDIDVQVTARHVEVPKEVREYAQGKAGKLPRYYDRIHEIEVIFDHESEQFTAEMIVRADHRHTFVATETGPDTYALIDLCVEKLERQLTRHKEKRRNRKHEGGGKGDLAAES